MSRRPVIHVWQNETTPGSASTLTRGLTRLSDSAGRGLPVEGTRKLCRRCGETKSLDDFHVVKGEHKTWCKVCWRAYNAAMNRARPAEVRAAVYMRDRLRRFYKMTVADYERMLAVQDGRCAACGDLPSGGIRLAVDHDHACCPGKESCGKCVRALLCQSCNGAAGLLRDSPDRAMALAAYLIQGHDVLSEAVA
jgi:hypothetical protein